MRNFKSLTRRRLRSSFLLHSHGWQGISQCHQTCMQAHICLDLAFHGRLEEENRALKEELKSRMDDLEKLTKALTSERDDLVKLLHVLDYVFLVLGWLAGSGDDRVP